MENSATMQQHSLWGRGSQVVYREVWRNKVWTARPVTVVQDTPDLAVLYICSDTRWKIPSRPAGYNDIAHARLSGEWGFKDVEWKWGDTLYWVQPGAGHAVHIMWNQVPREFVGWYVNLQEPIRRTRFGFDFMDQDLDIVVKPDACEWHWKDEDVMQQGLDLGIYTATEVQDIRAEGERVVERIRRRAAPFDDCWLDWKPDSGWPVPVLPAGWDQV
jgi:hypothetical protein